VCALIGATLPLGATTPLLLLPAPAPPATAVFTIIIPRVAGRVIASGDAPASVSVALTLLKIEGAHSLVVCPVTRQIDMGH